MIRQRDYALLKGIVEEVGDVEITESGVFSYFGKTIGRVYDDTISLRYNLDANVRPAAIKTTLRLRDCLARRTQFHIRHEPELSKVLKQCCVRSAEWREAADEANIAAVLEARDLALRK